jgi:error-prone DNA polymerase
MIGNMIDRGYDPEFAKNCFEQIKGFGSYGFPESHAAAFAQLVYISSWLKHHHPDAFCCGLLNSQPMGFYAPAQIVGDARKNGVEVREIDVSFSFAQNTLEKGEGKYCAVRLGFRQIDGFHWLDEDEERLKQLQSSFRDVSVNRTGTVLPLPLAGEGWGGGISTGHTARVERAPTRIASFDAIRPSPRAGEVKRARRLRPVPFLFYRLAVFFDRPISLCSACSSLRAAVAALRSILR